MGANGIFGDHSYKSRAFPSAEVKTTSSKAYNYETNCCSHDNSALLSAPEARLGYCRVSLAWWKLSILSSSANESLTATKPLPTSPRTSSRPQRRRFCQRILADTSDFYLANVATWADSYRENSAGKFSARYLFIDAQDNPPRSCSVDYDRDYETAGCVVRAINDYVSICSIS